MRRHSELEHEGKDDDQDDDDDNSDNGDDDDDDVEYKPSAAEVKTEIAEDSQDTDEMPPLTAEEMAEVGPVDGVVVIPGDGVVPPDGVIVIPGHRFEPETDDDYGNEDGELPTLAVRDRGPAADRVNSTEGNSAKPHI